MALIPWFTTFWRSDMSGAAHLVGIVGFALIIISLLYTLRKRKWILRRGKMSRWLLAHHWFGFIGGILALVHTLGNFAGFAVGITIILVLVLSSSGMYLVERRLRRPVLEKTEELQERRRERTQLDATYRDLYSRGQASTQQGVGIYNSLLAVHEMVTKAEDELEQIRKSVPNLAWWRHVHNVGTMMLVGVLLVHIWSKLYFAWGGL
jgi:hypothetical protein